VAFFDEDLSNGDLWVFVDSGQTLELLKWNQPKPISLQIPETTSEVKEVEYLNFTESPKSFINDPGHTFDYASFLSLDCDDKQGSKSEKLKLEFDN